MSDYFIDPISGNDSHAGTSIGTAWLTLQSGATTARVAAGDRVKIKKSPDPTSIGNATWVDNNSTITLATALTKTIDRCEVAWTGLTNVTATRVTSVPVPEGAYYASLAIAGAFTTGLCAYSNFTAINLSTYTKVTFWIKANIANIAAGVFSLILSDQNGCANIIENITINTPIRAYWQPVTVTLANPANCTAIVSVGLNAISDPGTATVYLDNIETCNTLTLNSLVGKNLTNENWYPIRSIVGTSVVLGCPDTSSTPYFSPVSTSSESVATYARTVFNSSTPGLSTGVLNKSGTAGSLVTYSGGWDFDGDGTQNGLTFFDGQSIESQYGLSCPTLTQFAVENMGFVRFYYGIYFTNLSGVFNLTNFYTCGCTYAIAFNNAAGIIQWTLTNIYSYGYYDSIWSNSCSVVGFLDLVNVFLSSVPSLGGDNAIFYFNGATVRGNGVNCFGSNGYGLKFSGFVNCDITNAHTRLNPAASILASIDGVRNFYNPVLAETTKIAYATNRGSYPYGAIAMMNYQGTAGDDRVYFLNGEFRRITSGSRSGYAVQMIPYTAAPASHWFYIYPIPVTASTPITISIYLKKTSDYNGSNPSLSVVQNGLIVSTVTSCAVTTSYVQYSVTYTPALTGIAELMISCDGTVGSIYVDDLSYGTSTDGLENWYNGLPIVMPGGSSGGSFLLDGGLCR